MLDIRRIKENPEEIIDLLARKGKDARETIERILELDNQRRVLVNETDNLKAKQNAVSKQIPAMKKAGQDTAPVFAEAIRRIYAFAESRGLTLEELYCVR